jgi:outer membrane murein-binding lipoprotein Lpp
MSDKDSLSAEVARLDQENTALREAIGGFRWLANNLHNSDTEQFRDYYRAALEDARKAMGDDWQPINLEATR